MLAAKWTYNGDCLPRLEVVDPLVGVDAGQSVYTGVDMRQQWCHWLELVALQSPDTDPEHDIDEYERRTGHREYEQEPWQDDGNQDYVDGDVDQSAHRVVG